MGADYYSDRTRGPRARTEQEITLAAWGALWALVHRGVASGIFAEDFPSLCPDGPAVIGTDEDTFWLAFRGDLPELGQAPDARIVPDTLAVLDMAEFMHAHASQPRRQEFHSYFQHHHLRFARDAGQENLREKVNRILARYGLAYELGDDGQVRRVGPPVVDAQVREALGPTVDADLDALLDRARREYTDPDPAVRREALEHAWDAFERAKTILNQDKRRGSELLIETVASDEGATLVRDEMTALTRIGNEFRIRHHETDRAAVTDELVDPLFARMYALLHFLHSGLNEEG